MNTEGHRKSAFARGGSGRVCQQRLSKPLKRKLDRLVDKRRRQAEKANRDQF